MKFFTTLYKNKKAGLSLLLAMIGSTIALSIVASIVTIVIRSVEQSQDLERSTQVFFAIESGLEAGFFHHNARGQGVSFLKLNDVNFPSEQTIKHSVTTINSSWTLDGRANSTTLTGLIYENTPLQLRWFWDTSDEVTDSIAMTNYSPDFQLTFNPSILPLVDFGSIEDRVLISWLLTKKSTTGISSLTPMANDPDALCTPPSSFICRNSILSSTSINYTDTDTGVLLPRTPTDTTDTISNFISTGGAGSNFQLILTPTLEFQDSISGNKIPGIPFEITGSYNLPRSEYSIHTATVAGDFSKDLDLLNIPEQTSIQAFNYVIFD